MCARVGDLVAACGGARAGCHLCGGPDACVAAAWPPRDCARDCVRACVRERGRGIARLVVLVEEGDAEEGAPAGRAVGPCALLILRADNSASI